ncbi:hypothetical protein G3N57_00775 [Paraburkholderia sp. Se-20369]|nr:hypothetical protein [Paraburkholderia sp. Se-20369]
MTVMYFNPTPDQVAASLASDCPMATPRDPSNCKGRACISWDRENDRPCAGHRGNIETAYTAGIGWQYVDKNGRHGNYSTQAEAVIAGRTA